MRVSEAQKRIDTDVERVLKNWENGNLKDALEIVKKLNPLAAGYVVAIVCERMGKDDSGIFIRRLLNDGLDIMVTQNW